MKKQNGHILTKKRADFSILYLYYSTNLQKNGIAIIAQNIANITLRLPYTDINLRSLPLDVAFYACGS